MNLNLFRKSRLLAATALVAAALVFGIQAFELQHQHSLDDPQVECLLCKTSVDDAPVLAYVHATASRFPYSATPPLVLAYPSKNYQQPTIRGPPA